MDTLPDDGYLLDQLLSGSLDSIFFKDRQSCFVMCNQSCANKHGWASPDAGRGKTDFDAFTNEHAAKTFADEQRIIASGEPLRGVEEKETWQDGRVTWCSTTKAPMRDENGNIVGILGIARDITAHKEAELQARRYAEQIGAIKEGLEEDAQMAGKLQRSFFLAEYPVFPDGADPSESCAEFLHHFNKNRLVSGNYCHVRRLSATRVGILMCDVLGAGVRAALGAALIRGIMQDLTRLAEDPSAYVGRLNEQLHPLLHPDRLLLDVTACYMVLDCATGQLLVASAGHPLPLHFRDGQSVKWLFENLVLRGPALAVDPHARFRTISCRMRPGDSVVLYTDGLLTVKNSQGEPFCDRRLLGTAQALSGKPLGRIFSGLKDAAIEYSAEGCFGDDVCLVGFHLRRLLTMESS